jgi:hypothetical protein
MRRLVTVVRLVTVAALTVPAIPSDAQVYPERIHSVTRTRVQRPRVEQYQRSAEREEQSERFTKTVRIGANGQIDVSNIAGDITVSKGNGNDAVIEVVKTARGRTVEDAREMLKLVQIDVTERAGRAEIRTRYPESDEMRARGRRSFNVSVAYTIAAPPGARMAAKSISGNINVRDIRGELSLDSTSGNIKITNAARVVNAKSISGNVEITNTELDGMLDASSISGSVILRQVRARGLDLGSVSGSLVIEDVDCDRGDVQYSGRLASGGRYELRSHSGEIRIAITGDTGFEIDANSFSGSIRSDLPITLQGASRDREHGPRRRALHGVYGNGSAMLDLTTFSGSIVIVKR